MHRTQIYIDDDIFSKVQNISKSLNISISEFIRTAINNQLNNKGQDEMSVFFDNLKPINSFDGINSTEYVDSLRSNSRIIDE